MSALTGCALLRVPIDGALSSHVLPDYFTSADVPRCKERDLPYVESVAREKDEYTKGVAAHRVCEIEYSQQAFERCNAFLGRRSRA